MAPSKLAVLIALVASLLLLLTSSNTKVINQSRMRPWCPFLSSSRLISSPLRLFDFAQAAAPGGGYPPAPPLGPPPHQIVDPAKGTYYATCLCLFSRVGA